MFAWYELDEWHGAKQERLFQGGGTEHRPGEATLEHTWPWWWLSSLLGFFFSCFIQLVCSSFSLPDPDSMSTFVMANEKWITFLLLWRGRRGGQGCKYRDHSFSTHYTLSDLLLISVASHQSDSDPFNDCHWEILVHVLLSITNYTWLWTEVRVLQLHSYVYGKKCIWSFILVQCKQWLCPITSIPRQAPSCALPCFYFAHHIVSHLINLTLVRQHFVFMSIFALFEALFSYSAEISTQTSIWFMVRG